MAGLSEVGHRAALEAILPQGTDVYLGLFTTVPALDGTGGIEVGDPWYARVAHDAWKYHLADDETTCRTNKGAITFAAVGGGDPDVTIEAWGVFDAAIDGALIAWGLTTSGLAPETKTLTSGDQVRFSDAKLFVCMSNAFEITDLPNGLSIKTVLEDTVKTTDATPTTLLVAKSFDDVDSAKIIVEITAKGPNSDDHYSRRIVRKYYRDDMGLGLVVWNTDEAQTEGDPLTYPVAGFTPSADLVISGNNVEVEVTGIAATTIDWAVVATVINTPGS